MIIQDDALAHYGTPRHSGRYPWGSGGEENANNRDFLGMRKELKDQGLTEAEIARGLGFKSTTDYRAAVSIAVNEQKAADVVFARKLKEKNMSIAAIASRMGRPESTVRSMLADTQKDKADILASTAEVIRAAVDKYGLVDVGVGNHLHLGVSNDKFKTAVAVLKQEGYKVHYVKVTQLGTGKETTIPVLSKPGVSYSEVFKNRDSIHIVSEYSEDGGKTYNKIEYPTSISSKRVAIRYAEQGGATADGVLYLRPGVDDISLGGARYAQVRVAVDGTHFIKGMAMYKDDLPPGVDIQFNTNKSDTGNKLDALKPLKADPKSPFGAVINRQHGVLNIVNEEGNWDDWSKTLSSQMLSKQSPALAEQQLRMKYEEKKNEFDEIMALTNPTIRKKLLDGLADDADSSAVHLKAAAIPRTANRVIIPMNSMKETEVYAPQYRNGERVALIRHPHGGTFEIPDLVVNNNNPTAKKALGNAVDAIGIHSKVAERLSGADFDGDTVLVIPNNHGMVNSSPPLVGLKNFDPKVIYKAYPGMKPMSERTKQVEMGVISNLITDMTILGASHDELARAVRHSMVVIDAEKHNLNYKQSYLDNGIGQLKKKYQARPDGKAGAATLISRARSQTRVEARKPRSAAEGGPIDAATGKKMFTPTGETWVTPRGKVVPKTTLSTKLAETDDAHTLSSGTRMETVYADHSNRLKALANLARKESLNTKPIPVSASAKTTYSKEVVSLNAKLSLAERNAPLERQAQVIANAIYRTKLAAEPDMDKSTKKREKYKALAEARRRTGAGKNRIEITPTEWEAIQSGAISPTKLSRILDNSDLDAVKMLATPKVKVLMSDTKKSRAKAMLAQGYTQAEVADHLGVSLTTLKTGLT